MKEEAEYIVDYADYARDPIDLVQVAIDQLIKKFDPEGDLCSTAELVWRDIVTKDLREFRNELDKAWEEKCES